MRISDGSSDVCSSDLERLLVLRRYGLVDQHRLAGQRIGRAVGEIVVGAVGGERHQDQQARAEAEPAPPALPGLPRSAERRVGKAGVRTCGSRWSPYQ